LKTFFPHEKKLAFLVALYATICFLMIIGEPTFLDPILTINVRRFTNFLGLWILIFSIPIYILIYKINLIQENLLGFQTKDWKALNRGILSSSTLGVFGIGSLINFNPFPNVWVMSNTIVYSASIGIIIYAQNIDIGELNMVKNRSIKNEARIEIIRSAHTTCLEVLKILITISIAFGTGIILSSWQQMRQIGLTLTEANLFYGFICLNITWWGCGILFGIVRELLWRMWVLRESLSEIKFEHHTD